MRRWQGCQEHILIYCTEGSGTVTIGNESYQLKANQYIVIPQGAFHEYYTDEVSPWTIYWIHFQGTLAAKMTEGMSSPQDLPPADNSRLDQRNRMFDELYAVMEMGTNRQTLEFASCLFIHYMATLRYLDVYRFPSIRVSQVTHADTIVRKSIHYMNEHVENRLTIDELAEFCGLSKSYFYRKFVKESGIAPIDYFTRLKINRACFWLMYTNMSISQIAARLSFSESQYFARIFKKIMGISATDYRNKGASPAKTCV